MALTTASFNNNIGSLTLVGGVSSPGLVREPVTVMPGLTGNTSIAVGGPTVSTGGVMPVAPVTGNNSGSTGTTTTNTTTSTGMATATTTGILGQGTRNAVAENVNTTTSPDNKTFWDKYKVWAIPGIALVVILVGMYFFMKAKK